MKKIVTFALTVILALVASSSFAEDMPVLVWETAAPKPAIQTGEITDSWEEIIAAIDDGSAKQRYAVGATKELDLGSLGTVHMQLAGFDLDDRTDRQGKAATTWIAVELLPEERCMNEERSNIYGWWGSNLRKYLLDTVLPAMPSLICQRIISVVKRQTVVKRQWKDDRWQTTEDKVWIPDHKEIFGENALYYELFLNRKEKRVKCREGSAAWWWLRSAYISGSASIISGDGSTGGSTFYNVGAGGISRINNSTDAGGVALGFCL